MQTAQDLQLVSGSSSDSDVSGAVTRFLHALGVTHAFGVSGGGIAPLWRDMVRHDGISVIHCRHEGGAAFAAAEASLATGRPTVVFATTGPGITNALTGLFAAKTEGATVIFLSPATPPNQRGTCACQEVSDYTFPISGLFTSGPLFDFATIVSTVEELPQALRKLAAGVTRPNGFVAHLSIPLPVQKSNMQPTSPLTCLEPGTAGTSASVAERVSRALEAPFAIWVGHGARYAAQEVRQLAERTGAAVMCTPRGKGIMPETHPQFVGVTGFAGHSSVIDYMRSHRPQHVLVLGTRMSEFSSFWDPELVPSEGFIQVDLDQDAIGSAYPQARTWAIVSEIGSFLRAVLEQGPRSLPVTSTFPRPQTEPVHRFDEERIDPKVILDAIQTHVVEGSDATVMLGIGNSFAWGIHHLRFDEPRRFRTSTSFGSMGQSSAGIIGTAAAKGKTLALVGDGSMLMNNEINTAVQYGLPAVWVILNDGCYNMVDQVMPSMELGELVGLPSVDFSKVAEGSGARAVRITKNDEVRDAIEMAMAFDGPILVDAVIDPRVRAPTEARMRSLRKQRAE